MTARMNRRLYGLLAKRLDEARLDAVRDPRDVRGKRWQLSSLLRAVLGGLLAGARSLADVEAQSERLSRPLRRLLGVRRRVADTTLRDALCSLEPNELRKPLHALVREAQRRKALEPDELPFGVVSLDGKYFSLPSSDDYYAQRQTHDDAAPLVGVVRTVTATLTSISAQPIIDVTPIPAHTNEMGIFELALDRVCQAFAGLDLFRLVTYDAGACSKANARAVRERDLHYLFVLKTSQSSLYNEAQLWLGSRSAETADAIREDMLRGQRVVRRLYLGEATAAPDGWEHLRTVVRVQTQTFDASNELVGCEDRYLISSLPRHRLTPNHWLLVVRRHWGVETSHQILDGAFAEDDHPWILQNPRGALVVAILRRIAYTILTLFRSVTQRSDERRHVPWKLLLLDLFTAFLTTNDDQIRGLRFRPSS
jgi:DDE_Tnp_1-associated/Transposase DDE domain